MNSITENVVATAQFSKTTLGIVYTLSEYVGGEKCYYATEYNGTATELYIPDIYNGLPVRHVGAMTVQGNFTNNKNLTKIVLGANVKRIQSNTFANQTKLVELQLNNSLVAIGSSAFSNCMKLEYVFIPKSVTNIGSRAFYKTGTTLVLHILSDIDLTDGWPTYWDYDFYNSSEFPSILLTGVDSNKPLNYYGEFVYTYKNGNLILVGYSGGNEVVIPEEIEGQNIYSLGVAFWYNRKITKITINASLYEIGEGALRTTTSLVECVINKPITKNITEYDFANSGIKRFVINANQVSILGQIYHSGDILNIN